MTLPTNGTADHRPTPADVPAAQRVTVRGRSCTWVSPPLATSAAHEVARELRMNIVGIGSGQGFVSFDCGDGRQAEIRAREVAAVEVGPAIRQNGTRESGVHVAVSASGLPDDICAAVRAAATGSARR